MDLLRNQLYNGLMCIQGMWMNICNVFFIEQQNDANRLNMSFRKKFASFREEFTLYNESKLFVSHGYILRYLDYAAHDVCCSVCWYLRFARTVIFLMYNRMDSIASTDPYFFFSNFSRLYAYENITNKFANIHSSNSETILWSNSNVLSTVKLKFNWKFVWHVVQLKRINFDWIAINIFMCWPEFNMNTRFMCTLSLFYEWKRNNFSNTHFETSLNFINRFLGYYNVSYFLYQRICYGNSLYFEISFVSYRIVAIFS